MSQDNQILSHEAPKASRRAILTAAPAAAALAGGALANSVAIGTVKTTGIDPIFVVLAEHREAVKAYLSAAAVAGGLVDHTPEGIAASSAEEAAIKLEYAAFTTVLTTDPTTLAGTVALLDHVGQDHFLGEAPDAPYGMAALIARADIEGPLAEAVDRFPARLATALRNITAGGKRE
jgi:hypothetical protein